MFTLQSEQAQLCPSSWLAVTHWVTQIHLRGLIWEIEGLVFDSLFTVVNLWLISVSGIQTSPCLYTYRIYIQKSPPGSHIWTEQLMDQPALCCDSLLAANFHQVSLDVHKEQGADMRFISWSAPCPVPRVPSSPVIWQKTLTSRKKKNHLERRPQLDLQ